MQLISYLTQIYFGKKCEDFTERMIAALGIFNAIELDKNASADYNEVLWIEENTHPDVMVPIYKLDRNINPTKEAVRIPTKNLKMRFRKNDTKNSDDASDKCWFEANEDTIQYYLCKAIRRVNDLIVRNLRNYSEEIKIPNVYEEGQETETLTFGDLNAK
jgi:hypothetical protein